jgi:hypothetical protein
MVGVQQPRVAEWRIGIIMETRMTSTPVFLLQRHRIMAAGCFLCVAAFVAWSTAAAFGKAPSVHRPQLKPTPFLVSVSTLDMSRLVPAQFGDWDAAAQPPR